MLMHQNLFLVGIDDYPFTIKFVPECYKTQEMYNKNVITCFFLFGSAPDWYKTQKMCDEAVDDSKITNKILEKFHDSLLANDDIFFFDEVIFYANEMGISHVRLLAWGNKFEQRKAL